MGKEIPPHPSADHIFIQTNTLKCGCRNFRLEKDRSTDPYKPTKVFFFIFIYYISVFPLTISSFDFIAMCTVWAIILGHRYKPLNYKLLIHIIYKVSSLPLTRCL